MRYMPNQTSILVKHTHITDGYVLLLEMSNFAL